MSMKILYAGSPQASQLTLSMLYERQKECGFEIAGVLSNPPSAKGRHKELIPTSVDRRGTHRLHWKKIFLFSRQNILIKSVEMAFYRWELTFLSVLPMGIFLVLNF